MRVARLDVLNGQILRMGLEPTDAASGIDTTSGVPCTRAIASGNYSNLVSFDFEFVQVDHAGFLCVHNNTSKYGSNRYRAKGDLAARTDLHPRRTAATTGQSYSDSGKKSSAYARRCQTRMDNRML